MTALRRLLHLRPGIACAILALALAMKLLVPAGFMPSLEDGHFVVTLCSGTAPAATHAAMPGMAHHAPAETPRHDPEASAPCAYAGLTAPSLAAVDPVLLAGAILAAIALALRPITIARVAAPPRLRPPLRGPPRPA